MRGINSVVRKGLAVERDEVLGLDSLYAATEATDSVLPRGFPIVWRRSIEARGHPINYHMNFWFSEWQQPEPEDNGEIVELNETWMPVWQELNSVCREERILVGCKEVYRVSPERYRDAIVASRQPLDSDGSQ